MTNEQIASLWREHQEVHTFARAMEAIAAQETRNACAAIARQWDADHPASNYGGCIANLIEARGQDAS
jgi:hypothetical protein